MPLNRKCVSLLVAGIVALVVGPWASCSADPAAEADKSLNAGFAYAERHDFDRAEQEFKRAVTLNPKLQRAWANLGSVETLKGALDDAWMALLRARELDPSDATVNANIRSYIEIRFERSVKALQAGETEDAIKELTAVIAADPNHVQALTNLGGLYAQAGRFSDAVPALERVAQLQPTQIAIRMNLGVAYMGLNRLSDALGQFKEAARLDPADYRTHYEICRVYDAQRNYVDALRECSIFLEQSPSPDGERERQVRVYVLELQHKASGNRH